LEFLMRRVLALLLCAFLVPLSAASLAQAQEDSTNMSDGEASAATARLRPSLTFSPAAGWPGSRVELTGQGFLPFERVRLLVGRTTNDLKRHRTVGANRRGRVQTSMELPDWARPGRRVYFALQGFDGIRRAVAGPFRVIEQPKPMTIRGTIVTGGAECPLFRSDDGRRFSLAGNLGSFRPGDRVTVRGRVAEVSTCMQRPTLAVQRISKAE
jgi:uncharacterized protein DUF5818